MQYKLQVFAYNRYCQFNSELEVDRNCLATCTQKTIELPENVELFILFSPGS